jgi:hypothetical protein
VLQLDVSKESQKLVLRLVGQTTAQSNTTAHTATQNQRILDTQQSDEFRKVVAWLALPHPGTNHATSRQHHERAQKATRPVEVFCNGSGD